MWHCMRRNILRAFRSTIQSCVVVGGFLTALVLYETITGEPADLVTPSSAFAIEADTQRFLAQMATYAHEHHPACEY